MERDGASDPRRFRWRGRAKEAGRERARHESGWETKAEMSVGLGPTAGLAAPLWPDAPPSADGRAGAVSRG